MITNGRNAFEGDGFVALITRRQTAKENLRGQAFIRVMIWKLELDPIFAVSLS